MTYELWKSEYKAMKLLAQGLSYKQVCEKLNITHKTLNNRCNQAYAKLEIKSKASLPQMFDQELIKIQPDPRLRRKKEKAIKDYFKKLEADRLRQW